MKNFDPNNRNLDDTNFVIEIGDGDESEEGDVMIDDQYQNVYVEEDEENVLNVTSFTEDRRHNCLVKLAKKEEYEAVLSSFWCLEGRFWVEKRDHKSFLGQNMSF